MNQLSLLVLSLVALIVATAQAAVAETVVSFAVPTESLIVDHDAVGAAGDLSSHAQPDQATAAAAGALDFRPPDPAPAIATVVSPPVPALPEVASAPAVSAPEPSAKQLTDEQLFNGGSESLVARVVGAAEGTRTPDGGKTQNYYGHVDPGNGVWNRGTFSYQFGNGEDLSPETSDQRQLDKLQRHYQTMQRKAAARNLQLDLEETLNGIDLANQAPLAVTEDGGYVERLAEAKQEKGLTGEAAILEGRVWAFWDTRRGGWDAPGLRAYDDISKEESIRRDQIRRMGMIAQVLQAYRQEGALPPIAQQPASHLAPQAQQTTESPPPDAEYLADLIIFQDLPDLEPSAGVAIATRQ